MDCLKNVSEIGVPYSLPMDLENKKSNNPLADQVLSETLRKAMTEGTPVYCSDIKWIKLKLEINADGKYYWDLIS